MYSMDKASNYNKFNIEFNGTCKTKNDGIRIT